MRVVWYRFCWSWLTRLSAKLGLQSLSIDGVGAIAVNSLSSRLGFGCVRLSSFSSFGAAKLFLNQIVELGIRHFDTAPSYGRGYSEIVLGKSVRSRRSEISIATKFSKAQHPTPRVPVELALMANAIKRNLRRRPIATQFAAPESRTAPKGVPLITQQDVEASLMGSLNALGTDYIDYFLLHETPPDAVRDDALEFLLQAKLLGRIGKTGIAANGGFLQNYSESDLSD